ncbi:MAG: glycerate kinase [Vibrio sp.]|uniref:glycerate kinase n=1 Tax=Vibrio TaxID=662 RepID=UPI001ED4DD3F|nr:glycerate kinase [Vibrio sp.]NRB66522.1 glycerate kinase [Vibrio sp.]
MKIVIAPDSFKESLTAVEVAQSIQMGLERVWPDAEFVKVPVADGGEGTVQSLIDATSGQKVFTETTGPLGETVQACYGVLGDGKTAVIEIAEASGLHLVPAEKRDPKITSSFGTGELIKHALSQGISRLIVGLGGSATNDAGAGMLAVLGVTFIDKTGEEFVPVGGASLANLARVDTSKLDPRLHQCEVVVACDVDNPLCGALGASAVFGPQKGATEQDVTLLDQSLEIFGQVTKKNVGIDVLTAAGAGAAGGMGAALLGYANAVLKPGIEIVLDTVKLESKLIGANLVITGEGKIDDQTVHGKTPVGVAKLAKQFNLPVIALAGCTGSHFQAVYEHGIDAVYACLPRPMSLQEAFHEAASNLANVAENVARTYQISH